MSLKTRPFDPAEYLDSPDGIAAYLADALHDSEPSAFTDALGVVARARGMTQLARDAGLSRPALYKSLSASGKPEFATILKVLRAVGVQLTPTASIQEQEVKPI